jgi:hypothetical protein
MPSSAAVVMPIPMDSVDAEEGVESYPPLPVELELVEVEALKENALRDWYESKPV